MIQRPATRDIRNGGGFLVTHNGDDATCGTHSLQLLLARRKKSALSFFFYIRERGKKNHRFSLRSTRRQLYESLPWSLDLRHISSDVLRTTPPPALSFVFYPLPTLSLPPPPCNPRRAARRRRYYLFRKLTPGRSERDWKILRSSTPSFSAFINRRHSPG